MKKSRWIALITLALVVLGVSILYIRSRPLPMDISRMIELVQRYEQYPVIEEVVLDDQTRIESKSSDPEREMFHVAYTPDGKISYQYYDAVADMFYSISAYEPLGAANAAAVIESKPVATDVGELRCQSTETSSVINAVQRIIRNALKGGS